MPVFVAIDKAKKGLLLIYFPIPDPECFYLATYTLHLISVYIGLMINGMIYSSKIESFKERKWINLMFCFCLILLSKKLLIGTTSIKYEPSIIFLFHNLHLQTRFWTWFVVVFCNLKSGEANEGNFKSHWRNLTLTLA